MDDRLQRVEAELKEARTGIARMTILISLFMLTLIGLVVVAAMATDIFKVEYNGVTRLQVDDKGTMTINADSASNEAAIKFLSASSQKGDIRFVVRNGDPTDPSIGDFWYNANEQKFKFYDGFKRTIYIVFSNEMTQVVDDANTVNNNDGTRGANSSAASDDPTWTQNAKLGGSALSFDGTNDYVVVPDSASLSITGNFTLEAWIKTNSNTTQQGIIEKYDGAGYNGYVLRITSSGKLAAYTLDAAGVTSTTADTTMTTGVWHHVSAVYNGSTLIIYLDGVDDVAGPETNTRNPADGTNVVYLGARNDANFTFNGLIDEVAIWNVALSPAQIAARYNGGAGAELVGNEAGLVSVWHMNDPK